MTVVAGMTVGYTAGMMVREMKAMYEFERCEAARLESVLTPARALQLYDAMWELANTSGALRRDDPLEGIEVARTVNALAGDRNI